MKQYRGSSQLLILVIIVLVIPYIYSKTNLRGEDDNDNNGNYSNEKFYSSLFAIFFSGLGDKSFLITAFMSMKYNKVLVFLSGFSALTLMGIISIQFGKFVSNYINQMFLNLFGGVLFILMGVYFIVIPIDNEDNKTEDNPDDEIEAIKLMVTTSNTNGNDNGLYSKIINNKDANAFIQSFGLIFFSELGDKSQIAAIYISANSSILMAFTAITTANALLTLLGVFAGELVKKRLSKKTLAVTSGVLFIIFGLIFIQSAIYDTDNDSSLPPSPPILFNKYSGSTLLKRRPID